MPTRVRKAVFPVAGLGTRLLPATKSIPKEMITIVDRPLIQYAVDEAREAGIEQLIFVTGRGKAALDDYFDVGFELEATMRGRGLPRIVAVHPFDLIALDCSHTFIRGLLFGFLLAGGERQMDDDDRKDAHAPPLAD
jgi:hypothetical protein